MKSQTKTVLIIAYAFPPHSVVGAMRPLRIVKYLRRYSHWVPMVITVRKDFRRVDHSLLKEIPKDVSVHRTRTIEPLEFLERSRSNPIRQRRQNDNADNDSPNIASIKTEIESTSLLKTAKLILTDLLSTPDPQTLWNLFVIIKGLQVIRKTKIDMIFVTTPPWSALVSGFLLSKLTKTPWIADFRDPWTDIKRGRKNKIREKLESLLEKKLLIAADGVISTSNTYTDNLKKKYPYMDECKFYTLHNGFDETKFSDVKTTKFNKFTVIHLGSLYSKKEPYAFMRAFRHWIRLNPEYEKNVKLVFVGEIDQKTKSVIEYLNIKTATKITGFIRHEKAIQMCMSADLLLLAMGTGPLTLPGWLPSKVFEYIACNRPILANAIEGEAVNLVRQTRSGYVVTSENTDDMVAILSDLYKKKFTSDNPFLWKNDISQVDKLKQRNLMPRLASILEDVLVRKGTKAE